LECIHQKLGGTEVVTQNAYNEFWSNWYGPILKTIYQKHGRTMWDKRIIYGFISTVKMEMIFKEYRCTEGAFAITFCDSVDLPQGQVVISYISAEGIQHYKLTDKEQKQPIQDYLASKKGLMFLLQPSVYSMTGEKKAATLVLKEAIIKDLKPSRSRKSSDTKGGEDDDDDKISIDNALS